MLATVIGATGAILVFRTDLEAALYTPRVVPATTRAPISQVIATVTDRYPDQRLLLINLPADATRPYEAVVQKRGARDLKDADQRSVYLDPADGRLVGERRRQNSFIWAVRDLHFALMAGAPGLAANGYIAAALLVMAVTGLLLWLPNRRWQVRWSGNWNRTLLDLHHVIGIAALVVIVVTSATGI